MLSLSKLKPVEPSGIFAKPTNGRVTAVDEKGNLWIYCSRCNGWHNALSREAHTGPYHHLYATQRNANMNKKDKIRTLIERHRKESKSDAILASNGHTSHRGGTSHRATSHRGSTSSAAANKSRMIITTKSSKIKGISDTPKSESIETRLSNSIVDGPRSSSIVAGSRSSSIAEQSGEIINR